MWQKCSSLALRQNTEDSVQAGVIVWFGSCIYEKESVEEDVCGGDESVRIENNWKKILIESEIIISRDL